MIILSSWQRDVGVGWSWVVGVSVVDSFEICSIYFYPYPWVYFIACKLRVLRSHWVTSKSRGRGEGEGRGFDLGRSLEAKFEQGNQIRGNTWEVKVSKEAKIGNESREHTEIQRGN